MSTVTLDQAQDRWVRHTAHVVSRPFGPSRWSIDQNGNPQNVGDTWTITFLSDPHNGHVYGSASLNHYPR